MRLDISRARLALAVAISCVPAWAQTTQLVSVHIGGVSDGPSSCAAISADGRYVAFASSATNLVPGDTNGRADIFVRDRQLGTTAIVSVDSNGVQGLDHSYVPAISADGRYVAFYSDASNLVPNDVNGYDDVFVRDRVGGTTAIVSDVPNGAGGGNGGIQISTPPAISADGRYVAFVTYAYNLVPNDNNGAPDVFVRDRNTGATTRVSVDSMGMEANSYSRSPSISADGRYVAFTSHASNLVSGDTNGVDDIFLHDLQTGATERMSLDGGGIQGDRESLWSSVSADGNDVVFSSNARNLVAGDINLATDVFLRERSAGTTERVSVANGGTEGDRASGSYGAPWISPDGRYVVFDSRATNLIAGWPTNQWNDVFVRDRLAGTTDQESLDSNGLQANGESDNFLYNCSATISADGRFVVFSSVATNLIPGGTTGSEVFIRDRNAPGFTSICDPGVGSVIPCPCGNPPAGTARGCDNSSATGGASLSASGVAYLSTDSLVFTTTGERPTAFSIVMQGNALLANGVVYGQGVRCAGGATKRLFTKHAIAGSITAPDFGAGDPTVSVQSAAKGDVIQPAQSRWYLVFYRDPVVLGGCSATSTFNATQTGQVTWWP
jgi:Tol biopolymer transport system component